MSAIASVYVVASADLPALLDGGVEHLYAELDEVGEEIEEAYTWSGWVLYWILDHLREDKGIDLTSPRYDIPEDAIGMIVVDPSAKRLLPEQDPQTHDPAQLRKALARRGMKFDEAELAAFDALSTLSDAIEALPDDHVLVIECGV